MVASDRGQVLLLGGLAIAIVFLTAIPLSNSLVVTESASTSETVNDIDRAAQREASVERGVRALLADVDTSNISAVNESLRAFSSYYTNVSGQQSGVYVNASVNMSETTKSLSRDNLANPDGSSSPWDPVTDSSQLSTFNLTLEASTNGKAFKATVNDSSGDVYTLDVKQTTGPSSGITVSTDRTSEICTATSGEIQVDVLSGTCYTSTGTETIASFTPADGETYGVEFQQTGNDKIDGNFTLAGTGEFYPDPEVTVQAIDVTFVGSDVSYERTISVNETS